jgi:hypothetical protein
MRGRLGMAAVPVIGAYRGDRRGRRVLVIGGVLRCVPSLCCGPGPL